MKIRPHSHSARPAPRGATLRCLALALSLAAATPWALAVDAKASQYYEDALQRVEKQDYAGAIVQLKNALKIDNKQLPVHMLMGKALMASGQAAAAEAAYSEALKLGVNRGEVLAPLARTLVAQGKLQEVLDPQRFALNDLPAGAKAQLLLIQAGAHGDMSDPRAAFKAVEEARAVEPGSIDGWLAEVPLRIRARQFKEALAAVENARRIDPKSAGVHYQYASVLHVQGDLPGALAAYDKALLAEPTHLDARLGRAGVYLDLKRDADAAKDVEELLAKSPQEPRAWYLSAQLAEREGKQAQMLAGLRKITDLMDPVPMQFIRFRPQMLLLNGQAHYGLGEREKAQPYFEAFQHLQPGTPVSKLLANIYTTQGNQDRAIEVLETYLRGAANDSQAMALLASAYMAKGRNARAAELMQRALKTNDSAELYTAYGLSLMGAGQNDAATTQLETAYKKDPGQTQAAFALVGLYLRADQPAKALNMANALVKRQPNNPGFLNLLGQAKVRSRDVPGARTAFELAAKLDPSMVQARLNLARLEIGAKNLPRAVELLDAILKADPNNTEAMYELAQLSERRGQPEEALRWLQKAFDIAGAKDLRSSLSLVDLHLRQGRRAEALKAAQSLASAAPESMPALLALTRAQLANNDTQAARTSLASATKLANFDAATQAEIATLQMGAGNLPGAAYSLEKALSSKPDYLPALVLQADVEIRQGEFPKAEQHVQQIIRRVPKEAVGYGMLGDLAVARKQPAAALDAYRKAHQVQPSTESLQRLFAAQLAVDIKPAVQLAEQWLKNRPRDAVVRNMLAQAHVRSNNLPAARVQYEQLREMAPKNVIVLNDLANVLLRMNDPQAAAVAEQALAVEPANPAVIDTAGWAAYKSGKLDRAVQLLRDARLRRPESRVTRYHLAATLAKAGRNTEARQELDEALRGGVAFEDRAEAESLLRSLK